MTVLVRGVSDSARFWCVFFPVEKEVTDSFFRVRAVVSGTAPCAFDLGSQVTDVKLLGIHKNDQLPLACLCVQMPVTDDLECTTQDLSRDSNAAFVRVFKYFVADNASLRVRIVSCDIVCRFCVSHVFPVAL